MHVHYRLGAITAALLLTTGCVADTADGQAPPQLSSRAEVYDGIADAPFIDGIEETSEAVVAAMVEAHGGLDRWRNAPTVRYDNVFFNPFEMQQGDPDPWWLSRETFDQATRRGYHDWPSDGATLVYDGSDVWTTGWSQANMPTFQSHFFYTFVNLPWLTQDEGVRLGDLGRGELPGYDQEFYTVRLDFDEVSLPGRTTRDAFLLYIDPETYLLRGYQYWIGYRPMLELMGVEGDVFGPMLRVHEVFQRADGLVVPLRFHTMAPDASAIYGYHLILNPSFSDPFDASRMERPADAVVDAGVRG